MRISYRQGLVSAQTNFLQIGQNDSRYVDVIVSPTPVIASIAQRDRDYLIDETVSVNNAWGPFSDSQTYYLYWEIVSTGDVARGATTLSPMTSSNPPAEQTGQMWFDTAEKVMKVFDGVRWTPTLRVLAGTLHSGGILVASNFGSQVGLNEPTDAGYILRDAFGNCFRDNHGNLLTSAHPLTSSDTGSLVKFDGTQLSAQANENIPRFSLVYLIDGRAALASGIPPENIPKAPLGIVTEDAYQNTVVTIVTAGKTVFNEQWNFAISDLGKPVWCGPSGEVALNKPLAQKNMRVGTIITKQSILMNFDWETEASTVTSGVTGILASAPLNITGSISIPMVNIQRADSNHDGFMNASDFARIPALELLVAGKSDIGHTHIIANVAGLQTALDDKANILHTQDIASIIDLQTTLDGKAPLSHNHLLANIDDWANTYLELNTNILGKIPKVVGGAGNFPFIAAGGTLTDSGFNDASFALASHTHAISDVSGLVLALADKSDVGHGHAIADIADLVTTLAGKAPVIHSHIISDVADLATTLADKSNVGHGHAIADIVNLVTTLAGKADMLHIHAITDITGLQTALDSKAQTSHTHVIGQVDGLQIALDGKANIVHTHTISNVTGLDFALAGKSDVGHTHMAVDVEDFVSEVFTNTAATLVAGTNITLAVDNTQQMITINSTGGGGGTLPAGTYGQVLTSDGNVDVSWQYVKPRSQLIFLDGDATFGGTATFSSSMGFVGQWSTNPSAPPPFVSFNNGIFLFDLPETTLFKITVTCKAQAFDSSYGNDVEWPQLETTKYGTYLTTASPTHIAFNGEIRTVHYRYIGNDQWQLGSGNNGWTGDAASDTYASWVDVYYVTCSGNAPLGETVEFGISAYTDWPNATARWGTNARFSLGVAIEEIKIADGVSMGA